MRPRNACAPSEQGDPNLIGNSEEWNVQIVMAPGRLMLLVLAGLLLAGCGDSTQSSAPPAAAADTPGDVAAASQSGEQVFNRFCASCHLRGLAGAVAVGDPKWQELLAVGGIEHLVARAREGVPPAMPPKGLCSSCSDAELQAAIEYMIDYPTAN